MRGLLRWLARMRIYSDIGMWYLPALDMVFPIVFGVIQQSIIYAIAAYLGIRSLASLFGYWDVTHGKRIQYQNEFLTRLNPYLVGIIRGKNEDGDGRMAKRIHTERGAKTTSVLWPKNRKNYSPSLQDLFGLNKPKFFRDRWNLYYIERPAPGEGGLLNGERHITIFRVPVRKGYRKSWRKYGILEYDHAETPKRK